MPTPMHADIDPAEMKAAKAEIKEAMMRRYAHVGRSPAAVYGAMTTVTAELLAEMTVFAAKDEAHAKHLCGLVTTLIETHAEKIWKHKSAKRAK